MKSNDFSPQNIVALVTLICASIFSFVAMILAFATDFGYWWTGEYSWSYFYFIGSENAPIWAQFFLVLLALLFLLIFCYSVIVILINLNVFKLPIAGKILAMIGIALGSIAFVFTGIIVGLFAIFAGEYDWWLTTSFYSSLVGSILIIIFYIIYLVGFIKEEKFNP